MSTIDETSLGAKNPLEELELALQQEMACGKSKLEIDFKEAYPLFERHLAHKKMRKRTLMDRFNVAYTHELNLAQFRKLLNAERERREASGDVLACVTCGELVVPAVDVDTVEDAS